MATNENLIPIPGRLHSVATEGHVAGADEIFDDSLNKDQATINQEVNEAIGTGGSVDSRISAAINALDASVSKSVGADGLALSVIEENGKVTAINGSIAANTYDAYGAASAAQSAAISAAATDATTKVNAAKSEIKGTATSACDTLGEAETKINANATAISSLSSGKADKATTLAGYGITDAYTKSETYTKTEVNGLVDTPHQEYVTVDAYASLPATGSKDTIYRVSNYNGSTSQVDASVYSEYAWDGSQYVFLCVKSQIGEVFDISVYNNNAKYADLAAALNGGANIPQSLQKGGMSVKFVQSSDNKYVQYRLMADEWSTNTDYWSFCGDDILIDNPEFIEAKIDSEGKLLEARRVDGTKVEYCDLQVEGNIINEGIQQQIDGVIEEVEEVLAPAEETLSYFESIENPEWLSVTTDSEGRILGGRKKDGTVVENCDTTFNTLTGENIAVDTAYINTLNLSENGINALIDKLEEHGISGEGVTQEELDEQLEAYETKQHLNTTLQSYMQLTDTASNIADEIVTMSKLSPAVKQYIDTTGGGTITNYPDDITIETKNNVLSLKDFAAGTDTWGYKLIAEDITLTQSIVNSWEKCIVEIKAVITLPNSEIVVPKRKVILLFNGGVIQGSDNTTFWPQETYIIAKPYQIFKGDIRFRPDGTSKLIADVGYAEWFGAVGDGETWDAEAFNKLNAHVTCNEVHLLSNRIYALERTIAVKGTIVGSVGSKLKRMNEFVDVPILSPIDSTTVNGGTATFEVDTTSPYYDQLTVGMMVNAVNQVGGNRYIERSPRVITSINGSTVICKGNELGPTAAANTASLVSIYTLINLSDGARLINVTIEGGRTTVPYNRAYWEQCATITTTKNNIIKDCVIKNSVADGIVAFGINNRIINNKFRHSGANGIHYSGCIDNITEGNYIFDSNLNPLTGHNEGAITYSNNIANVFIHNNVFDTCYNGIGSIDTSDNCKSIITDNLFLNFRQSGIQGASVAYSQTSHIFRDFIISGNRFVATQNDIDDWEQHYHETAIGEQTPATGYGIALKEWSSGIYENIVISNNTFRDCGIYLGNCELGTIQGNSFISDSDFSTEHPSTLVNVVSSKLNIANNIIRASSNVITKLFGVSSGKVSISNTVYDSSATFSDTGADIHLNNNIEI